MRSQLRFVMHPDDEKAFEGVLLAEESVQLIDGPRWKSAIPVTTRSLAGISGFYCILWSPQDAPELRARRVVSCDDWYCESEQWTIQFLRSQLRGSTITEGRIAISTPSDESDGSASGVEARFRSLRRFIKGQYTNSILQWRNPRLPKSPRESKRSPNPSKPDSQVWVGPSALRWLRADGSRRVRQGLRSAVEATPCPDPPAA